MNKLIKLLFLSLAIIGLHLSSMADPVDLQTAQSIAIKFMATNDLQLAATYQTDKNAAAFYVFNSTDGFVIVSADDCETPIIGYSREGCFDPDNIPVQMEDYLQDFVVRLQYGIENHVVEDAVTTRQWELVKATGRLNERKNIQAVGPLLTEKWHQGCLYNSLCPEMSGPCDHAEVGCVAVAMGQIMHYWGYPATGWGSNSYYNQGTQLSADFGNTTYDWEHMPDSLTDASSEEEIEAVATLLYHCGVSVKMEYGNNGSNASSSNVPDAMSRYFDYSRRIHREKKVKYSNEEWLSMLKSSLDSLRPVYYSGQGSVGGHAFVCDGYDDNDLLHFNWGWGGNGDGYFALGNLNPISYSFNNNNYAIFDIIPEYDPCVVTASAYPSTAGTIEGIGEYHIGVQCTLTAVPAENYEFRYWKHDDRIISYEQSYSFEANNDVDYMVAYFVSKPLKEIWAFHAPDTNDINSPYINLSWSYDDNHNWILREEFEINGENLVTTDGEHIYTAFRGYNGNPPFSFGKYTMDGNPVEFFNIDGVRPDGLTCDGNHFYCTKNISSCPIGYLYCYDFTNKTLIDSTYMNMQIVRCAYDADNDGFWFSDILGKSLRLLDRQGQQIHGVNLVTINGNYGFGSITAEDGNPHLLIATNSGMIINYDIYDESYTRFRISLQSVFFAEACIGKYDGKDAMFVIANNMYNSNKIRIYEINSHLAPIMHYRLYRARCETETSEADTVMLADTFTDTAFTDTTWSDAPSGTYRFGISEVYFNGVESEIIWSDTIVKTGIGLEENGYGQEVPEQPVQKIIENGQIIIIKDGKRYSVSGQRLK